MIEAREVAFDPSIRELQKELARSDVPRTDRRCHAIDRGPLLAGLPRSMSSRLSTHAETYMSIAMSAMRSWISWALHEDRFVLELQEKRAAASHRTA